MKKTLSKKASAWVLAGTASLVAAAGATAAIADSEDPAPAVSAAEKADTYLQAAQKTLLPTGTSVSSIDLAATRDGVDYYALRGDKDHCILAAGNSLACAPNDSATPLGLPIAAAESHPVGYAFWTDGGSLSANASDSGAPLKVTATQSISFVELGVPGQGFNVTWIPNSGEKTTFSVRSASEIADASRERRAAAPRRR